MGPTTFCFPHVWGWSPPNQWDKRSEKMLNSKSSHPGSKVPDTWLLSHHEGSRYSSFSSFLLVLSKVQSFERCDTCQNSGWNSDWDDYKGVSWQTVLTFSFQTVDQVWNQQRMNNEQGTWVNGFFFVGGFVHLLMKEKHQHLLL